MAHEWDETQKKAISRICDVSPTNRIAAITGEAGTGKTSLLREGFETLRDHGYSVLVMAPTGKAAKRIYELTGIPAVTIHRGLEFPYPGEKDEETGKPLAPGLPRRDRENPLNVDVLCVDEYRMVPRQLHAQIINAMKPGSCLRLFGDVRQLPAIEPNYKHIGKESPFEAAIRRFDGIELTTIHRHDAGSGIAQAGRAISQGKMPRRAEDFTMKFTDSAKRELEGYVIDHVVNGSCVFADNRGQIIVPQNTTYVGAYKLNIMLQNELNKTPLMRRLKLPRNKWQEKLPVAIALCDKVIWTENSYDLRNQWDKFEKDADGTMTGHFIPPPPEKMIMNGESGVVVAIHESGQVDIDVGDRIVEVPHKYTFEWDDKVIDFDPRVNIALGYAITTHKAQGSEWDHVVYLTNRSMWGMHCRQNLYTGVTRGRKHVHLIIDQGSMQNCLRRTISLLDQNKMNPKAKK